MTPTRPSAPNYLDLEECICGSRSNIVVERLLRARIGQLVPLLQGGNITVIATEVGEAGIAVDDATRRACRVQPPNGSLGAPSFPSPTVAGAIRGAQIISLYFARPLLRLTTYGLDLILHVSGRWILTVHAQDGELDERSPPLSACPRT
jgi:hypothetical protein